MITWGFPPSYSDAVVLDQPFTNSGLTLLAAYIYVGVAGDIVWENNKGEAQWAPGVPVGTHLLGAKRILSAGTVNGTPRITNATTMTWFAVNQLYNTP